MGKLLFVCYPKCDTCRRARAWLRENGVEFEERDIKTQNPTADELREWVEKSGLPLKKWFNTSGILYKSLGLRDRLPGMSREEQIELLASDGMLVKRPLAVRDGLALVGFRPEDWEKLK